MNKHIAYGGVAAAVALALGGLGAGGAGASATATGAGPVGGQAAVTAAKAVPGAQLWVARYDEGIALSVAVSPGGDRMFATGISSGDYATVAYNAATGAQLWVQRYDGPGNGNDRANSVAVSPSGDTVFVTGISDGGPRPGDNGTVFHDDYATVAYDAATGARLWLQRYDGPAMLNDGATSVAVSPSGGTVYVTGSSYAPNRQPNYATVAYNAATGAQLWVNRYNGPSNGVDRASSVAVSPGGRSVYVTGFSGGGASGYDYATVAYNAATGARLWVQRYRGAGNGTDRASSVAVSPGGGRVFVTGYSKGATSGDDYATVAYNPSNGVQLWAKRYNGPGNDEDQANSLVVSPSGGTVYVTGKSARNADVSDYATVAYNAATGARRWLQRYTDPANFYNQARSVAVSPSGDKVFVTGTSYTGTATSYDYATLAYNAATGAQMWVNRYNGPGSYDDDAYSLAVSPTGDKMFVTGYSEGGSSAGATGPDYATIAYSG